MISSNLRSSLKYLNGYLPVYKPRGLELNQFTECIKQDLYFVLNTEGVSHGSTTVNYARYLESFADGIVTYVFGPETQNKKYFTLAEYKYKATIELGVDREHHCIDGQILATSSIDHVTEAAINSTLPHFIGRVTQERCPTYSPSNPIIDRSNEVEDFRDYYRRVELIETRTERPAQKYPYVPPERQFLVYDIKLMDYQRPFARFDITCHGCFSVRRFSIDLAARLGTHASVVELTRTQEGPITMDDLRLLPWYETHLEYYIHRLPALQSTYRRFTDQMGRYWDENIKT